MATDLSTQIFWFKRRFKVYQLYIIKDSKGDYPLWPPVAKSSYQKREAHQITNLAALFRTVKISRSKT